MIMTSGHLGNYTSLTDVTYQGLCRKLFASSWTAELAEHVWMQRVCGVGRMAIEFKGVHYPKAAVLHAVFFYVRYAVSYRDLEEILAERGVAVDHAI